MINSVFSHHVNIGQTSELIYIYIMYYFIFLKGHIEPIIGIYYILKLIFILPFETQSVVSLKEE